jgi:hypothetical protein
MDEESQWDGCHELLTFGPEWGVLSPNNPQNNCRKDPCRGIEYFTLPAMQMGRDLPGQGEASVAQCGLPSSRLRSRKVG